jgi:hypothetical protein
MRRNTVCPFCQGESSVGGRPDPVLAQRVVATQDLPRGYRERCPEETPVQAMDLHGAYSDPVRSFEQIASNLLLLKRAPSPRLFWPVPLDNHLEGQLGGDSGGSCREFRFAVRELHPVITTVVFEWDGPRVRPGLSKPPLFRPREQHGHGEHRQQHKAHSAHRRDGHRDRDVRSAPC